MYLIQGFTTDPLQNQKLVLPDGTSLSITLKFVPMQYCWFIETLTYNSFTLQGHRLCTSPNMIHQYKNQIPFGLACYTIDNGEPKLQEDLTSGYAVLYILSQAETEEVAELFSG